MKEKNRQKTPDTYAEFIGSFGGRHVRIVLSNGERREGILLVHADYVTFEDQFGGFPFAHIAAITPLDLGHAEYTPPKKHGREHGKSH